MLIQGADIVKFGYNATMLSKYHVEIPLGILLAVIIIKFCPASFWSW